MAKKEKGHQLFLNLSSQYMSLVAKSKLLVIFPNVMVANTQIMESKGTQLKGKLKIADPKTLPCPWLCDLVPTNVPDPAAAQPILHPRKDVFVLKVAKVSANGDRRCKMELELVTPKGPPKKPLCRIETREAQCDPEPEPCVCVKLNKKRG